MASADRYADGEWNFYCDLCGRKEKSSRGVKTWDNHYVCQHHKEQRNPQDFLAGVRQSMALPWTRPKVADQYVTTRVNPILDTSGNVILDWNGIPLLDVGG
jgi:hypothetical protein